MKTELVCVAPEVDEPQVPVGSEVPPMVRVLTAALPVNGRFTVRGGGDGNTYARAAQSRGAVELEGPASDGDVSCDRAGDFEGAVADGGAARVGVRRTSFQVPAWALETLFRSRPR